LVDAPEGMTINTTTGVINWKPLPTQVGAHTFKIRATDLAGNQRDQSATINISVVRLAQFSVSITDLSGNPLTSIEKGQEFFLVGRVQDLRGDATGVSAAFFDVAFDSQFASVQGSIEHLNGFTDNASGAAGGTGLDEVGGSTTATNLAGQLVNIFRVKMKAEKTGQADFSADIAESHSSTARTATSSGSTTSLDASNLLFTGATLSVVPNFKIFDQTANVDEDTANREIDVLGNATKPSGETLTIDSVGPRDHGGSVQIVNNKLVYTPAANFFGEETFTYTVKNSTGDALTATVRVQVANVNDPPTAANDSITVAEDSGVTTIDVLANDSFAPDPQETLTIKSVSAGSKGGTIQIDATSNVIRYKPAANANGTETFTYTISDGHGGEATATVTVTITPVNDNPTAVNDTQRVPQNSTDNVINVLANDGGAPDVGETITIVSKTDPAHGTLKLQGGQLLYTPTAGFRGVDTFTYTISDGNGGTATATATIEVANSNSPPIGNDDKASTKRNTSVDIDVLGNDSVNGDTGEALTVSAVTQPTTGGKVSILANGKIRFEPTVGFVGKTTFTYTVSDPLKATDTATVEVEVLGIAPSELAGFVFMDLNNNGVKDSNEPGLAGVTVKLDGKNTDNASVSKTATTDLTGRYVFSDVLTGTYTITETQPAFLIDGQSLGGQHGTVKTTNVLNVNLSAENTKANDLNFTELGRQPTAFKLYELFGSTARNSILASGVSGQSASWLQSAGSQWSSYQKLDVKLSADGKTATIEATNAAGVRQRATAPVGPSQLVRVISTDGGNTLVRLFGGPDKFNLQSVANVAPSFTKGDNRTVLEDAAKTTVSNWATNIKAGGADDAGQTVTFTVTSDKPELFEELPAIDSSGTLTFKPKANANGVATLRVVAKDNGGTLSGGTDTSPEQTFTITITAVNDAPSFTKGANQTVAEDAGAQTVNSWATNISKGPADEASQTVTFDVTSNNPNLFEVAPAIDANGKLTYTPKANASGVATVTVRLKDSGGTASGGKDTSDDQTFTITVTSTNDPPVAVADSATTNEGSPVTINVLSNDTEPDGDPLTVTILTPPSSSQGTAAVNADKTITFTPATNFAGQATFTYQISDGKGGVATGNVTVTVNEINDAPSFTKGANQTVAEDAGAQTVTNWATNISAGPSSESAQTLTFQVTNNNADLFEVAPAIDATGKLTYTPKANANGTATVTVVLKDNGGTANGGVDTSAAQTFTITVTAVNDTPTITPPSGSLTTAPDTNFEFSQANDTAIAVDDDAEAASQIEVDLSIGAAVGTLSLGSTTGITISTGGNGADQTHIVFRGTLANVATALDGLVYKPATGFTGDATISLTVDDLGNTGSGGPKTAQTDLTITVGSQSSQLSADSVDNFMSQM
jgi:VCBS repeat-containing protein